MAESKKFLLRLSPDLFDALRRWAQDDLRSVNGQIEYLLAEQARRAGRLSSTKRAHRSLEGDDEPERGPPPGREASTPVSRVGTKA